MLEIGKTAECYAGSFYPISKIPVAPIFLFLRKNLVQPSDCKAWDVWLGVRNIGNPGRSRSYEPFLAMGDPYYVPSADPVEPQTFCMKSKI